MALSINDLKTEIKRGAFDEARIRFLLKDPRVGVQKLAAAELRRLDELEKEKERLQTLLRFETPLWGRGFTRIAGVDEAGAGPLAGPLSAAAVIFEPGFSIEGIDDSKKLSSVKRDALFDEIRGCALCYSIVHLSAKEVDELNVYQAALTAMSRAVQSLDIAADHLLVDARRVPKVAMPQISIIGGDGASQSIAAASVLAKVSRDRIMEDIDERYPGYGFAKHKGYGTKEHMDALRRLGPSSIHRKSYAPVKAALRSVR